MDFCVMWSEQQKNYFNGTRPLKSMAWCMPLMGSKNVRDHLIWIHISKLKVKRIIHRIKSGRPQTLD